MTKHVATRNEAAESFGQRLARFRHEAGYTQKELGEELGISQRMVAYYEGQTEHPPTKLMPLLATALGVSADELLGLAQPRRKGKPSGRLARRLKSVEALPPDVKRQVAQFIDALLEREKLRRRSRAG